jgi:hypothetical protein
MSRSFLSLKSFIEGRLNSLDCCKTIIDKLLPKDTIFLNLSSKACDWLPNNCELCQELFYLFLIRCL